MAKKKKQRKPAIYLTGEGHHVRLWQGVPPVWVQDWEEWDDPVDSIELFQFCKSDFEQVTDLEMKQGEIIRVPRKRFKDLFKGLKARHG